MMIFGPVAEAAHGGHSSPIFDILVGSVVIILTWVKPTDKAASKKISMWIAIAVTAIGAFFVVSGLITLFH